MCAQMTKFSIRWSHGDESGVFECEAKSKPRAFIKLFSDLRSRGVVVSTADVYRVKIEVL